jgi:hypothetical protein
MPAYMGGLLLSLAAMVMITKAKKAFAPKFHEVRIERPADSLAAGGRIRIVYDEEPGYFLPPGFPSRMAISKIQEGEGPKKPVMQLAYRNLVDPEVFLGPVQEEGDYLFEAELFVCASPGVADCAKLLLSRKIMVRPGSQNESRLPIGLKAVAQQGLDAGMKAANP